MNSQEHEKQNKQRTRDFYPTRCQSKLHCSNKSHGVGTRIENSFVVEDRVQKHIYNVILIKVIFQINGEKMSFSNKQH